MSLGHHFVRLLQRSGQTVDLIERTPGSPPKFHNPKGILFDNDQRAEGASFVTGDRRAIVQADVFQSPPQASTWFVLDSGQERRVVTVTTLKRGDSVVAYDLLHRGT